MNPTYLVWVTVIAVSIFVFEVSPHGGEPFKAQPMHVEHHHAEPNGGKELTMEQLIDHSPTREELVQARSVIAPAAIPKLYALYGGEKEITIEEAKHIMGRK